MQMFQTMIAIFRNQEQGPMTPQCQIPFASQRQPQVYENPCMFNHSQPRNSESNYSRNNSSWVSYINMENGISSYTTLEIFTEQNTITDKTIFVCKVYTFKIRSYLMTE